MSVYKMPARIAEATDGGVATTASEDRPMRSAAWPRKNAAAHLLASLCGRAGLVASYRPQQEAERARRHPNRVVVADFAGQDLLGERVLQFALDHPLQWPGAVDRVVAGPGQPCLCLGIDVEADLAIVDQPLQPGELDIDDAGHVLARQA